ncbi:hypothetical protein PCO31111_04926 [Pandoraea communis]|uniref:Uncharacterized protein n=1 Tax=Pandoraea communis TaxID=2508297 RepID=A0A5E4YYQ5_9BURK|nr:hypothetical protein PCO31111_04926 [Pandoraea communis]
MYVELARLDELIFIFSVFCLIVSFIGSMLGAFVHALLQQHGSGRTKQPVPEVSSSVG